MEREFLTLEVWDRLATKECEEVGRNLARSLGKPWKFRGVKTHALGDQRRNVAFLQWGKTPFALIPGGRIRLGYDRKKAFTPTESHREEWSEYTQKSCGLPPLKKYLDMSLTRARVVAIDPLLMAVKATAVEEEPASHAQIVEQLQQDVFRPPSSDEWEHACAAGSRSLFRWGDELPTNRSSWKLHRQPNALGLHIAQDPYKWEVCVEPGVMRGGDGGNAMCGDYGFLASWIPLASAYVDPSDENNPDEIYSAHARHTLSLRGQLE